MRVLELGDDGHFAFELVHGVCVVRQAKVAVLHPAEQEGIVLG
jgi:hypothetical protein